MDYKEVDQIINSHGFASEPAFTNVNVAVRPITSYGSCVLGLYYPDTSLIIIPPDGLESTMLHELGHRFNHYYYDDLSEPAAEDFRKKYQGAAALMYRGQDFTRLPRMGMVFSEGEPGAIELDSTRVSNEALNSLAYSLYERSNGEVVPRMYVGDSGVRLEFTEGVDWLAIIAGSLALSGLAAIGYAIYKTAQQNPWIIPLALFGSIAGMALIGREAKKHVAISRR